MPARVLPGLGLNGFWAQGEPWKTGGDENWLKLSVLSQLVVESATVSLPASPTNGVIYIVPTSDATNKGKVAVRDANAWVYMSAPTGAMAWVKDTQKRLQFVGNAWADVPTGSGSSPGEILVFDEMPSDPPLYTLFMVKPSTDVDAPVVTSFVATSGVASPIPITSFVATDSVGVTGYWVGESSSAPSLSDPKWSSTPQTSYTTTSTGSITLYARARDAAGNISTAATQAVTIPGVVAPVEINWPYNPAVHTTLFSVQGNSPQTAVALVYTPDSGRKLATAKIPMRREIDASYPGTGTIALEVRSGSPTGPLLGTSTPVAFEDGDMTVRSFVFESPVTLTSGTTYFLVLRLTNTGGGQALYRVLTQPGVGATWADPSRSWASYSAESPLRLEFSAS